MFFGFSKSNINAFTAAFLIAFVILSGYAVYAATQAVSLSVVVASTLTFTTTTNQFPTVTPGTPVQATTTLSVTTNNAPGWNVTLSGDNVTVSAQTMNDGGAPITEITDLDPQWIIPAAAATTTAGNAVAITSGQDALAFRVMTASGTVSFRSTSWWGTSDAMFNASQLWAGIASSTNASRIGNAGTGSYQAAANLNTVQYYLDVPATQKTGTYTGPLTYTATANP